MADDEVAELLLAAEQATVGASVRRDRTALVQRLAEVRNWACLLAVVPPRDLETFELLVVGPAYSASASGRAAVDALRTETCLVVSLLPLGPLVRKLGAAERARARWTRWRRTPRDVAASMVEWRVEVARRVRSSIDSGFDGVYLDDLDLPFAHIGRPHLDELIRVARHALADHLLLAQAVDWLPSDVTFDALGPRGPLAPSLAEEEPTEWWTTPGPLGTGPTVGSLIAARSRRDLTEPWRRDAGRELVAGGFDVRRDEERWA